MSVKSRLKKRIRHLRKFADDERLELGDLLTDESLFAFMRLANENEMEWAEDAIKGDRRIEHRTRKNGFEESKLTVRLKDDENDMRGRAEIKTIVDEDGIIERRFSVRLRGGESDDKYKLRIDGEPIGTIRTNANGVGKLEFSSKPNEGDEQPLLKIIRGISADSTVQIGRSLVGKISDDSPSSRDQVPGEYSTSYWEGHHSENESEIEMFATSGLRGWAEYEEEAEDGGVERKFEIKVRNADAGESFSIRVAGITIGSVRADSRGRGRIEFSSRPDDDEFLLPDNFPAITNKTTVSIGSELMGQFSMPANGSGVGSTDKFDEFERKAALMSESGRIGTITYEQEIEHGFVERKIDLRIRGAESNSNFQLSIGDVEIGRIQTDDRGRGRLELSSMPDKQDELLLPSIAKIETGTVVSLGDGITGTFGSAYGALISS